MRKLLYLILIASLSAGCNNSTPVVKDFADGITSIGTNITCENIFISLNGRNVENNEFAYGERFYLNFDDLRGFKRENNKVLPGMKIAIVGSSGDTLMKNNDLYSEITDGFEFKPFQLAADLTAASPLKSGENYTFFAKIWDKNGTGTFTAKYNFKVISNDQIITSSTNLTFDEAYIYDQQSGRIVRDGRIKFDQNIYIILEGLKGLTTENNGKVFPGLKLKIIDSDSTVTTDFDDLFANYSEKGVEQADVFLRTSAKFKIEKGALKNPLVCNILIWDKKSASEIKIKTLLTVE